jgi:ribosomal protein S18 acetylase RimI-like enzyme
VNLRPLGPGDTPQLCALVDADRLPGQPRCTPEMVGRTLAGQSSVDAWWWQQLVCRTALGAISGGGELVGAAAAGRRADGRRYLLWLHAREDPGTAARLLEGLLPPDPGAADYAFWFATDLSLGLEGLPRSARGTTHEVLIDAGFTGEDRWLYLRAGGAGPAPDEAVERHGEGGDLRLELSRGGTTVAAAEVGLPVPGIGILWWIEVDPAHRRRGLGRQVLRAARHALAGAGARETVLFVDHDDPATRDRRPALGLYLSEGFTVVDHLWSYRRGGATPGSGRDG